MSPTTVSSRGIPYLLGGAPGGTRGHWLCNSRVGSFHSRMQLSGVETVARSWASAEHRDLEMRVLVVAEWSVCNVSSESTATAPASPEPPVAMKRFFAKCRDRICKGSSIEFAE